MISYIEGKLLKKEKERIVILANQIGYEILLPAIVMDTLKTKATGEEISFHIYYHQAERQPKPVLIGFNLEIEKEFFQHFISVEDIGPIKAVKALNIPVHEIASAIESKNADKLKQLKGIGARTAEKIIATLKGKVDKFALTTSDEPEKIQITEDISTQMLNVLVSQLGHKGNDAKRMIAEAVKRNRNISTFEELFKEVYRGTKTP
ncbi:MAG: Holliday junction DNA helicase RuvA [Desulfobacterales bacterium]|nr:Holliday junction DNA helicase RuvA [Desulfobacterales bacterium]